MHTTPTTKNPALIASEELETPSQIFARYDAAGLVADRDGYYYDPEDKCWQRIPELERMGWFGVVQLPLPLSV